LPFQQKYSSKFPQGRHTCLSIHSNMDPDRIKERLEEFPQVTKLIPQAKRVRLPGYRFAFNKYSTKDHTGKANIEKDGKSEVWGVLFRINDAALEKLKEIEGGYEDKILHVFSDENEKYEAVTFVAKKIQTDLKPTTEYLKKILVGARHYKLPPEYITEIEELA